MVRPLLLHPGCGPSAGVDESLEGWRLRQWRGGMGRGGGAYQAGRGGCEPAEAQAQVHGAVWRPGPRHAR